MKIIFKHYLILLIPILAIIFTILFTWPFATKLSTFFYDRGDYPLSGAILSYNEYSLKTGKIFNRETYFNGFQFYPQPYTLVYSDLRLLPTFIYSPIYWISHNYIFSLNLTIFLTFVLSFISSFYVCLYFSHHKLASLIGALIFTFNPLTYARFPEHFELLNKYFLPLLFLFAYKYLTKPNIKNALLFFLIFTLNCFSAIYFQIMSVIMLPIFILTYFIFYLRQKQFLQILKIIKYSLIIILFLPVILYFDKAYLDFSYYENSKRSLEENSFYSARLIDYFSSTPDNVMYGGLVKSYENERSPRVENSPYGAFNYQEHSLFLNILPSILFLIFLVSLIRKIKYKNLANQDLYFYIPLLVILITSFLFTFGPYYYGWNSKYSSLQLPYYKLHEAISIFQGIRAPTRFSFIFYVSFSIFTAIGAKLIFDRVKNNKYKILIASLIILLLWIENYTPNAIGYSFSQTSDFTNKVIIYKNLGILDLMKDKNTLHLPINAPFNDYESIYITWAAFSHEYIINGNKGSYLPNNQAQFLNSLNENLNENSLKKLAALNIDYVIFHKDLLKEGLGKYSSEENLYLKAAVFNNNDILIIDLKKYNYQINICDFEKDIQFLFDTSRTNLTKQNQLIIVAKNSNNCYFPVIYNKKYLTKVFYPNLIRKKVILKLPLLIEPEKEYYFSNALGNLKY